MNMLRRFIVAAALAAWALGAAALPTVDEVQAEVAQGHYARAEAMLQEVVAERPNSARAHYVLAEVLAHNGRFEAATKEAARARSLDPTLGFADPIKFKALEQLLERQQRGAANPSPRTATPKAVPPLALPREASSSGLPGWVWALALAAGAAVVWRLVSRRRAAAAGAGPGAAVGPAFGGAYPQQPMQPNITPGMARSGMLGTGLAAAGGFAAGMLAEKLLDGTREPGAHPPAAAGGLVPGMFDDAPGGDAARDLEQRDVDFGSGDGWGGDAGGSPDDAGSSDGW